jgi:hypothetical protein
LRTPLHDSIKPLDIFRNQTRRLRAFLSPHISMSGMTDQSRYALQQCFCRERLRQEINSFVESTVAHHRAARIARYKKHLETRNQILKAMVQFRAVHLRHDNICHQQVNALLMFCRDGRAFPGVSASSTLWTCILSHSLVMSRTIEWR